MSGSSLLPLGLGVSAPGPVFGPPVSARLKGMPVHRSMRDISELIYETCKTYLVTQAKFIAILWAFIAVVIVAYFGVFQGFGAGKLALILAFSLIGIIGSAIGESLGASALRIAGGIFTKIADIGSDLLKIVFRIKADDALNPGVIADCTGDNAGESVGPSADGFETYGVTGVALITFVLLAVPNPSIQAMLLVWLFAMRVMMVISSFVSYTLNEAIQRARYRNVTQMNFEHPLTSLVFLTSAVSVLLTFVVSYLLIGDVRLPDGSIHGSLWWQLSLIISCGTAAGAIIPEVVKVFTSTGSSHVREVVTSSKEGGASLNIISGLVAGNFSAYWMGIVIVVLMGAAYWVSLLGLGDLIQAAPVFAFGLVAFGFLGMGPVTIAVDSYGPVTDNAQSVYELSLIENVPNVEAEVQRDFGFAANFDRAKLMLEENDGAGNTFKATAKPVLIGTAVVGATTMIFSIIALLVGVKVAGVIQFDV